MAYHRHDAAEHPGYHGNDDEPDARLFFEEENDKYASAKYNENDDTFSTGYNKREDEEKKKNDMSDFEKQIEEESKPKYNKKNDHGEAIQKQAGIEIFGNTEEKKQSKKKNASSIEEAIEKAVKEEKQVMVLDR